MAQQKKSGERGRTRGGRGSGECDAVTVSKDKGGGRAEAETEAGEALCKVLDVSFLRRSSL